MDSLLTTVISSFIGALVAAVGVLIQSSVSARAKIDESLRGERLANYRTLWKKTGLVPRWPIADDVTYSNLDTLTRDFRDWYFDRGGICLSRQSRRAYGAVQEELAKILAQHKGPVPDTLITSEEYRSLVQCCSALRTELTKDLLSRERALVIGD